MTVQGVLYLIVEVRPMGTVSLKLMHAQTEAPASDP